MQKITHSRRIQQIGFLFCTLVLSIFLTGCAYFSFDAYRVARFVDMDAKIITVEYGEEEHDDVLEDGRKFSFKGKIRITLPDGDRVYLYQGMTQVGMLYHSKKKYDYHYFEKGPYCILSHDGKIIFEGYYCKDQPKQGKKKK